MRTVSTPIQVYEVDDDIVLRTAEATDAVAVAEYYRVNREHLEPWEPKRGEGFYSVQSWTQKLVKLQEIHRLGIGYYLLIIERQTGTMLGMISFSQVVRFPSHSCQLGYSLSQQAQGRGVMQRALRMAVDYMFRVQNMHRICAGYMPRNQRSEAVLHALGFEYEGLAKQYLSINGRWEDHHMMALLNPHWRES